MGKATINSHLGDGEYSITTVFDKAAAQAQKAKLEAILANVDERLAEDPGPEIEEERILLIRKTALEQEIARISEASELARTQAAWCADLVEDLSGTVGTIEIDTDARDGLMVQPGYAGNAAYDAERDAIEVPFRTLPVPDAILNFALMPAIQKWRPTYRYGTISNVNQGASTCDLALANANSRIRGININETTYFSGVPIEYMTCDGAPFANGDDVVAQFDPYDVEGSIKVIGFKSEPKPCESRHILIEGTSAWLLWDIVGKRPAYNLGTGAPTFPCLKDATTNAWIAAHVTVDSDDTLYAYVGDTVDNDYVKSVRDFGPVTEFWFYHQDNDLATALFLGGDGCNVDGWGLTEGSAVCIDGSHNESYMNPYVSDFPAHTGDTIETIWGSNPNWGLWAPQCCKYKPDPPTWPSNFIFYNSYREWFLVAPLDDSYLSKIVYSDGSESDRAFIVCSEGWGETWLNYQYYAFEEHYVEYTLSFFSPFESEALSTTIDLWEEPVEDNTPGIRIVNFSTQVQTKHNKNDMVACCVFSWKIHNKEGGVDQVGEDSPHADWYTHLDFNPEAEADPTIPNPWGSNLTRSEQLSTAFKTFINDYNGGTLNGFQYQFVDVT